MNAVGAFSTAGYACIHEAIEEQARHTPERSAVIFGDRTLSYHELNRRANQLAHYLRFRGVRQESVVGLGTRRSDDMIVALLAIWKAGGAYVPLEMAFPPERLAYTCENARPKFIITHESVARLWAESGVDPIFMDRDWFQIAEQSSDNPAAIAGAENLAQLLYTSGSTGRPKGVEILHRGLVNFMEWLKIEPGIRESDKVLAATTISFDTSGVELFMPLTVGATIVMMGDDEGKTTRGFLDIIDRHGVTVLQGTPTGLRWFTEYGWAGKQNLKIISGGEALSRELAEKLLPLCAELWNIYGPTESTIWSTLTRVSHGDGPVPIGHPIHNTRIYLLGPDLKPVPPGAEGEICIGGAGVARGYRYNSEATAQRFIPDPQNQAAKLYRTGDLGKVLPSGEYGFLGRLDHQIKINGLRMEPEEIEAAIMRFPGVKQCLVIAREDTPGEKRLVGYLVLQEGAALDSQELRQHLKRFLILAMIPTLFVTLSSLPKLINGKIDRAHLPPPQIPAGKMRL